MEQLEASYQYVFFMINAAPDSKKLTNHRGFTHYLDTLALGHVQRASVNHLQADVFAETTLTPSGDGRAAASREDDLVPCSEARTDDPTPLCGESLRVDRTLGSHADSSQWTAARRVRRFLRAKSISTSPMSSPAVAPST
jgi:hypothetical protein